MSKEIPLDDVIVYMRGHSFKTTKHSVKLLCNCASIGIDTIQETSPDDAIVANELMIAFMAGIEDTKNIKEEEQKENEHETEN